MKKKDVQNLAHYFPSFTKYYFNYYESQPKSTATKLFRDFIYVESFYSIS